jgi:hypothetical protein
MKEAYPKEDWIRIPHREEHSFRAPGRPRSDDFYGDYISTKRIIVRAGYFYSPMDMPEEEALAKVYQRLALRFPELSEAEKVSDLLDWLSFNEIQLFRHVLYEVRGEWHHAIEQTLPQHARNLRTFWYVDLPDPISTQMSGIRMKQIGYRFPGNRGSYWGPDDYDPPYLSQQVAQKLYKIERYESLQGGAFTYYIHPLDILPPDSRTSYEQINRGVKDPGRMYRELATLHIGMPEEGHWREWL